MTDAIAVAVREGLTRKPKTLPAWLFYDALGTELFEQITALPEYYPTRTELSIFAQHAHEMMARAGSPRTVIELGAGSALKTRVLLTALHSQQQDVTFMPTDVSPTALTLACERLGPALPRLKLQPLHADYEAAIAKMPSIAGRKLVLFIGSSVGNFEPQQSLGLLTRLRQGLAPGDTLLLGTDLRKAPELLEAAYNDAAGVTARFNLNVLERINRELGGHFALDRFRHVAVFDSEQSRIEMHLQSPEAQRVRIDALGLTIALARGESIHTENSYKFTVPGVAQLLGRAGFGSVTTWTDPSAWFAVHLATVGQGTQVLASAA